MTSTDTPRPATSAFDALPHDRLALIAASLSAEANDQATLIGQLRTELEEQDNTIERNEQDLLAIHNEKASALRMLNEQKADIARFCERLPSCARIQSLNGCQVNSHCDPDTRLNLVVIRQGGFIWDFDEADWVYCPSPSHPLRTLADRDREAACAKPFREVMEIVSNWSPLQPCYGRFRRDYATNPELFRHIEPFGDRHPHILTFVRYFVGFALGVAAAALALYVRSQ